MAQIVTGVLSALDGLKNGVSAVASALYDKRKEIAETAVFGVGALAQKPMQSVFEGIESIKVLRDFQINFGSQYMTPFGEVAYWETIVKRIKETNKELGLAGSLGDSIAESIRVASNQTLQFGFDEIEITDALREFVNDTQNNRLFTEEDFIDLGKIRAALGTGFEKIIAYNQQFGGTIKNSYTYVDSLLKRVDKYGLNAKQFLQVMESNLSLMNKYQFRGGIEGLEKATLYAQRYKINLDEIAGIADKAMNPEGALELSSQMAALGGNFARSFGDFYDVIEKSRNGVDGLSESLKEAFTGLATFNKEKGIFEINTLNRSLLKAAADNLGISVDTGYKVAVAAEKEQEVKRRIRISQFTNADEAISKIAGAAEFGKNGTATLKIVDESGKTQNKNIQDVTERDLNSISSFKADDNKDATQQLIDSNMTQVEAVNRNTEEMKRLFFSFDAYAIGGDNLKKLSEIILNQVKEGNGAFGAAKIFNNLTGQAQQNSIGAIVQSKDLNELMTNAYNNLNAESASNKKYLDEVIKQVFNDNKNARAIIEGAATIESASLGFLATIAKNTAGLVLPNSDNKDKSGQYRTESGDVIDKSMDAIMNTFDYIGDFFSSSPNKKKTSNNQSFDDRQSLISNLKPSSNTSKNEDAVVTHKFEPLVVEVKGDNNNIKYINVNNSKELLELLQGKYNPTNGGKSNPTTPYLKK